MPTDGLGVDQVFIGHFSGEIGANGAHPASHSREVIRLQSGLVRAEYSIGEIPQRAATFINQFITAKGNFSW